MVELMDPTQSLGFAGFLAQTDVVGRVILGVLFCMSLASWYYIVTKTLALFLERRKSENFLDAFWNAPSLAAVEKHIAEPHPEEPFSPLAWHAIVPSRHHERHGANRLNEAGSSAEFLTRAMRRV